MNKICNRIGRAFIIIIVGLLLPFHVLNAQEIVYVNYEADGQNNGQTWQDAFNELTDALDFTALNTGNFEVWVARGTYTPSPNATRDSYDLTKSFLLQNNVTIYGGFIGTEVTKDERDHLNNRTVLSGLLFEEIIDPFNPKEEISVYTVVQSIQNDETAVLDGFIISNGISNGAEESFTRGGGIIISGGNPELSNLTIKNNESSEKGGGIYSDNSQFTLRNSTLSDNSSIEGGGIYIENSQPFLEEITVKSNTAENGAGIFLANGSTNLSKSLIENNTAERGGAGLYIANGAHTVSLLEVRNNLGNGSGGGMHIASGTSILNELTIASNESGQGGGAFIDGTNEIFGLSLENNTSSSFGGGLLIYGNSIFDSLHVKNNYSGLSGGGISIFRAEPTIKNTIVEVNAAAYGGGGLNIRESYLNLHNLTVKDNTAPEGGGVRIEQGVPLFTNSIVEHNVAEYGGGIYLQSSGQTLSNVIVKYNEASVRGGGIYSDDQNDNVNIVNGLVFRNNPSGWTADNTTNTIINSTFTKNGMVDFAGLTNEALISNSIFWPGTNYQSIDIQGNAYLRYSVIDNFSLGNISDQGNNITSNPEFADPLKDDFQLAQISPAIDAGLNDAFPDSLNQDLLYFDRFFDGNNDGAATVDIGSYEWDGSLYLPRIIQFVFPDDESTGQSVVPNLSWFDDSLSDEYIVEISGESDFNTIKFREFLSDTSLVVNPKLDHLNTYYWRVKGLSTVGEGEWGNVWSFTTIVEEPGVVTLLSPSNQEENVSVNPTFVWEAADRAENYDFQVSLSDTFDSSEIMIDSLGHTEVTLSVSDNLNPETNYFWRVRAGNIRGEGNWSDVWTFNTEIATSTVYEEIPKEFSLEQNYPNPFNPTTMIRYVTPETSHVILEVYNVVGQRVALLVNERKSPGHYETNFDASGLSSGVYLYRLKTESFMDTRQMMLIK